MRVRVVRHTGKLFAIYDREDPVVSSNRPARRIQGYYAPANPGLKKIINRVESLTPLMVFGPEALVLKADKEAGAFHDGGNIFNERRKCQCG